MNMNKEFNEMFERDLVVTNHVVDDDENSSNVAIKQPLVAGGRAAEDIVDNCESSGAEEEEEAKHIGVDPHFDEMFDGIDNTVQQQVQNTADGKFINISQELTDAIVMQMEYYFSNENLVDDSYLVKQIQANNQYFISLKQFLSFRRMKKLTSDYGLLEHSIKTSSKKLEVNKKRVRRVEEIPKNIFEKHFRLERSVIVNCLPSSHLSSLENFKNHFQQCGNIVDIQIYTQMEYVPKDLIGEMRANQRSLTCPFGMVEYEKAAFASKASLELTDTSDWRRGMRVEMVVKLAKKNPNATGVDKENKSNEAKQPKKKNKKNKKTKLPTRPADFSDILPHHFNTPPSNSPNTSTQNIFIPSPTSRQYSPLSKSYGTSPSGKSKQPFNPLLSYLDNEERGRSNSFGPLSSSPGRWVQKRIELSKAAAPKRLSTSVLREPRGPDGVKGFSLQRTLPTSMIPLPSQPMPL